MSNGTNCYHCGEAVFAADTNKYKVYIAPEEREMCCPGCQSVAEMIVASGLSSYYEHRTDLSPTAKQLVPDELLRLEIYDDNEIQDEFVYQDGDIKEITLTVEGLSCAACAWLIERSFRNTQGIQFINVNATSNRISIKWVDEQIKLSDILKRISNLGYSASPFQADQHELMYNKQLKSYFRRLGLAGLATMQVMMFAVALYSTWFGDMEEMYRQLFRWVSLIVATPVLLYSAQPFYSNALRNLRTRTLGMDVPVSIALLGAYTASAYATMTGTGEVYFESISMFTFFLLFGRYLELRARKKTSELSANMAKLIPNMALRVNEDESEQLVPTKQLKINDCVIVKSGEVIPCDGLIIKGESSVDESMLTGEFLPIVKSVESDVYTGSLNVEQTIVVCVTKTHKHNLISEIIRLQNTAQSSKPQISILADKISRYFVLALLIISAGTYLFWLGYDPDKAFWITLSVLVATCPCALSLATPTALTCATSNLSRQGILIRKEHVLESLTKVDEIAFDKTGTLTKGAFTLTKIKSGTELHQTELLRIAASLEQYSTHPIASAFKTDEEKIKFDKTENHIGLGISGSLGEDNYKIGSAKFTQQVSLESDGKDILVYLAKNEQLIARFYIQDEMRENVATTLDYIAESGLDVTLLTGDSKNHTDKVTAGLAIKNKKTSQSPESKLAYINAQQADGKLMLMVGDGVNDAPVLSAATVSIAMGEGSDLAKNSADVVLLSTDFIAVKYMLATATKTYKIIKQNLMWALGYNSLILPLAISGSVPPYIAVIGMSLSSLLVIGNSLRLLK
ncbi:heavy metal translocating P-type ATPase [Moritella sp. F3]|uniref:heavy metal translocating P-type ATPase n=1 Tax=Moritella sp. F3 TaxID=2718882 RepID=UPI0018E1B9FC|nr:heavy metal translocating P-type ATPase [Moritella sp. F3]GIC78790.1 copper-translocating P-type ATPase [Moritella sp. F1]GIC83591.1 copper-translocating P-type ATPase [Moritella sp. F3]